MDRLKYFILSLIVGLSWLPTASHAATPSIQLVGPVGVVRSGETVTVEVRATSAGQTINAVNLHLVYSHIALELVSVQKNQTIWPLWPEEPSWNNQLGQVSLVAG